MLKLKTTIGLIATACVLIAAAAPASAWFEGTGVGGATGTATPPTESVLKVSPSSSPVICTKAGAEIKYRIQTKAKIGGIQATSNPGPHLELGISKWGGCSTLVGGISAPVTVEPCQLQVEQPVKSAAEGQVVTGSVVSPCVIKIPSSCTLKVPAQVPNEELNKVTVKNNVANIKVLPEITGLTVETTGEETKCHKLGLFTTKTAAYKTAGTQELEVLAAKLV